MAGQNESCEVRIRTGVIHIGSRRGRGKSIVKTELRSCTRARHVSRIVVKRAGQGHTQVVKRGLVCRSEPWSEAGIKHKVGPEASWVSKR